jgi:hypothetical protein
LRPRADSPTLCRHHHCGNCGKDCGMTAAAIKRKLRNFPGANLQLRIG